MLKKNQNKLVKITKIKRRSPVKRLKHVRENPACWKKWP